VKPLFYFSFTGPKVLNWRFDALFLEKRIFILVSARVLHTTISYYKSSLLLFLSSQKAKPNKGKID